MEERLIKFIEGGMSAYEECGVYPNSVRCGAEGLSFAADLGDRDVLIAEESLGFAGTPFAAGGKRWICAEQTHENAVTLRRVFPFTAPRPVLREERSCGVGDRLGIATPGHIAAFCGRDAYPILAQQSIRELTLTGRTFDDVLDCASFAAFREGYTRGFGADGDHLKTAQEVEMALACGYSMVTLDCSEHIRNVTAMTDEQVNAEYRSDPALEAKYIGKTFDVEGTPITFHAPEFRRMCLIYGGAIDFAASIYQQYFAGKEETLDFEISIDETETPTTPAQHFFVACELQARGVRPTTVAPRFCGEFQKGIDYIGDIAQFEAEFKVHAAIARQFGYKISVHSGSDKFSIFEIVGRYTQGRFHLKTAGTSWLEAMRIVARHAPTLYRQCHQYALKTFAEAEKYYHVTTELANIPPLDTLSDEQLPALFENRDSRQLIHITYGMILNEPTLREPLFDTWRTYRREYGAALEAHIGRHLDAVYAGFQAKP